MDIIYIPESGDPQRRASLDPLPSTGFVWLDIERESSADWVELIAGLSRVTLHEGHVKDSLNPRHPSFYDGTSDLEQVWAIDVVVVAGD